MVENFGGEAADAKRESRPRKAEERDVEPFLKRNTSGGKGKENRSRRENLTSGCQEKKRD